MKRRILALKQFAFSAVGAVALTPFLISIIFELWAVRTVGHPLDITPVLAAWALSIIAAGIALQLWREWKAWREDRTIVSRRVQAIMNTRQHSPAEGGVGASAAHYGISA